MVNNHALEEQSAMMMSRWLGPFKIKETLDNNMYIIQDGNMQLPSVHHADQTLYKTRPRLAASLKFYRINKPSDKRICNVVRDNSIVSYFVCRPDRVSYKIG